MHFYAPNREAVCAILRKVPAIANTRQLALDITLDVMERLNSPDIAALESACDATKGLKITKPSSRSVLFDFPGMKLTLVRTQKWLMIVKDIEMPNIARPFIESLRPHINDAFQIKTSFHGDEPVQPLNLYATLELLK